MNPAILPNIAFIGRAGSGKSTAAEYLVKAFGYEKLSFAAPLKAMCGTTTDRELLQRVGVEVRALVEDAWVNLLLADLASRPELKGVALRGHGSRRYVVDDCRFPNEAEALRREGFIFVRMVAPVTTRIDRLRCNHKLQDEAQLQHVSELALDEFDADYRIVNDTWPDALEGRVKDVLNKERR